MNLWKFISKHMKQKSSTLFCFSKADAVKPSQYKFRCLFPFCHIRTFVSRHRILSLWWPGGLPAQEQAHLPAVLPGQKPGWQQSYLRRKYSTQPEERVRSIWNSSLVHLNQTPCINVELHPLSLYMSLQLCVLWKREWWRIHGHE